MIRWEVWIGEGAALSSGPALQWRFNACFDSRQKAEVEKSWYLDHGYATVEVRARTTRYQRRHHMTTGGS